MKFSALRSALPSSRRRRQSALMGLATVGMAVSFWGCDGSKPQVVSTGLGGATNPTSTGNTARATNVLYTESNEPSANTMLAFRRNTDGSLSPLSGSPFDMRGQGLANPTENVGPSDADDQIITNTDHSLMFAVNAGSNTIAVMNINADGTLTHISGSPFASGGVNPISLALRNGKLYCANKNVTSGTSGGSGTPNYTVFNVASNGALTQIPGAVVTSPAGSSAAQIRASPLGNVMFTNDFLAAATPAPAGSLRSWQVNADGSLTQTGSAQTVPVPVPSGTAADFVPLYALTQGIQVHPTQRIFYACAPVTSSIGVYTYDTNGALSFNSFAHTTGNLSCWLLINKAATRMYVVSTGDNSLSTMDITNPLSPVEIQRVVLKDGGPTFSFLPFLPNVSSSTGSEETLDPSGNFLYVISHRNNPDTSYHGGNAVHVLRVNSDGTLIEPGNSVLLNTSDSANIHGILAL